MSFSWHFSFEKIPFKLSHLSANKSILGDPGAVSGGREKSKQARKIFGRRKSRRRVRAPGDKV